jgi:RNA polymerase sigma-70 factor, ECF subfamily
VKIVQLFSKSREVRERIIDSRERLFRVAYSWCHDRHHADDLCQETIMTALEKSGQLRSEDALDGWMFRIMQNAYRKSFRRASKQVDVESLEYHMEQEPPAEADVERAEEILQVRASLAQLNESQRMIIALIDIEGMSYKDAAEALEIPIGTVMSRLARARDNLCCLLQESTESEPALKLRQRRGKQRPHLVVKN